MSINDVVTPFSGLLKKLIENASSRELGRFLAICGEGLALEIVRRNIDLIKRKQTSVILSYLEQREIKLQWDNIIYIWIWIHYGICVAYCIL